MAESMAETMAETMAVCLAEKLADLKVDMMVASSVGKQVLWTVEMLVDLKDRKMVLIRVAELAEQMVEKSAE